jgi:hypothetical protein
LLTFKKAPDRPATCIGLSLFAFTMLAMLTSDLRTVGQVGSTVCIGLPLDTLIVRSSGAPPAANGACELLDVI